MENNDKQNMKLQKLKSLQSSFEESMKVIEKHVAESIANKKTIEEIKKDLISADEKFTEAEKCLDKLKIDYGNIKIDNDYKK